MNISILVLIAVLAVITLPTIGIAILAGWRRTEPSGIGAIVCSGLAVPAIMVIYVFVHASRTNGGYGDAMGSGVLLLAAVAMTPVTLLIAFLVVRQRNKRRFAR